MLIKYEEELYILDVKRVPEYKYTKYYDTTLIMLERTIYLSIIVLLVKCRFQNHWCSGKHNVKIQTVN